MTLFASWDMENYITIIKDCYVSPTGSYSLDFLKLQFHD